MSLASNIHELLLGGGSTYSYTINNSLRFRSSASAYLSRTPASAGNQKTWTFSTWLKLGTTPSSGAIFGAGNNAGANYSTFFFGTNGVLQFNCIVSAALNIVATTAAVLRDPSAWYHIVIAVDTTQATNSNGVKIYINGVQQTLTFAYYTQNANTTYSTTVGHNIGNLYSGSSYFDGYLAEVNFIDGLALDPSYFGATNTTTGTWAPKRYSGTYGTNGFYLPFSNTSGLTSGSNTGIGKDFSGNGNYWNTNNISLTAGSTYDAMLDSPTPKSTTVGNYAVLNPLNIGSASSLNSGNLNYNATSSSGSIFQSQITSSFSITSGKYYWEVTPSLTSASGIALGVAKSTKSMTANPFTSGVAGEIYIYIGTNGYKHNGVTSSAYGATYTTNDVIGVALDMDAGTITFYKNNTSQGTAFSSISGSYMPFLVCSGSGETNAGSFNFGQRPFAYTPPTGFKALQTYNLPTPTIKKGNQYFDATLWTGNGTSQTITNSGGFAPDFVWAKLRSGIDNNRLADTIRGANKLLSSNLTDAENSALTTVITGFTSSGFTIGSDGSVNTNSSTYVGWQWKGGGTAVTNTNGSITSQVSANPTAGFSVVTYTGTGANATVGHGLGVAPSMIIVKSRSNVTDWPVYHVGMTSAAYYMYLQSTQAQSTASSLWNNTAPTSTVFSIGSGGTNTNGSGYTYVAYCFAAIPGYSAFGRYTGNGSADGPFVFTGFLPKFVLIKDTTNVNDWFVMDTVRGTYNTILQYLSPNKTTAEGSDLGGFDILSNGFKVRQAGALNNNNATLIYAAFAQNPFQYSLAR